MTLSTKAPNESTTGRCPSSKEVQTIEPTNDPEDPCVPTDVDATVTLNVLDAYVANDGSIIGIKETKFDQFRASWKKYFIIILSTTLIMAGIMYTTLSLSGINRRSAQVNRLKHIHMIAIEVSGESVFQVDDSPQSNALRWMQQQDQLIIPLAEKSRLVQRYISAVIYFSLGGPFWYHELSFINGSLHECEWNEWKVLDDNFISNPIYSRGFHCRDNQTMSDLQFYHMNLTGSIPREIGALFGLITINLGGNPNIISTIPSEIGFLKDLNHLFLFSNGLYGEIPMEIQNATNINAVILYGNSNLSDNMDPFCNIKNIKYLQADCGNGTSKTVCECCTVCCNPDTQQCCTPGTSSCFSTDPETGFQ